MVYVTTIGNRADFSWLGCICKQFTLEILSARLKRGNREQQLNSKIHRALTISRENCLQIQPNQAKSPQILLVVT